jgi:hypothetical protein
VTALLPRLLVALLRDVPDTEERARVAHEWERLLPELEAKCQRDGLDVSDRDRLRELVEWGRGWVGRRREGER